MNKEKIIEAAHEGMKDAGSLEWFKGQVERQLEETFDPDPVAVTVSHAIRDNIDLEGVASTLAYYSKELQRAADAVNELCSKEGGSVY